jgi:hypothetical protein
MALPKQAQQQVEQANRLLAELNGEPQPEKKVELELVEKVPAEPVEAAVDEPEAQPELEPEPPPPEKDPFEERYRVLQGKYNSEVPRLTRQVSELNAQLEEMRAVIDEFRSKATASEPVERLITEEEIQEYGPDLVDLIGRRAKELYEPTVNSLRSEITKLQQQLGGVSQTVQTSARDRLMAKLDAEVEDWQSVNTSQDFMAWLDRVDPYAGEIRGKMLRDAYEINDADRVVAFFKGFLTEHAAVQPTTTQGSRRETRTPSVSLEEHVAPGRRKHATGMAGAQKEKRIWTQPEIAQFYHEVQKGKYRGKEDAKREIERDIIAATTEGRIR